MVAEFYCYESSNRVYLGVWIEGLPAACGFDRKRLTHYAETPMLVCNVLFVVSLRYARCMVTL